MSTFSIQIMSLEEALQKQADLTEAGELERSKNSQLNNSETLHCFTIQLNSQLTLASSVMEEEMQSLNAAVQGERDEREKAERERVREKELRDMAENQAQLEREKREEAEQKWEREKTAKGKMEEEVQVEREKREQAEESAKREKERRVDLERVVSEVRNNYLEMCAKLGCYPSMHISSTLIWYSVVSGKKFFLSSTVTAGVGVNQKEQ